MAKNPLISESVDPIMQQEETDHIACHDCDFSYIGDTKRSFSIRRKENLADIRHLRFDKSALFINMFLITNNLFNGLDQR